MQSFWYQFAHNNTNLTHLAVHLIYRQISRGMQSAILLADKILRQKGTNIRIHNLILKKEWCQMLSTWTKDIK